MRGRGLPRANFEQQIRLAAAFRHQLENSLQVVLLQPVDDEAIGRQQPQLVTVLDRLQRPNPGVELLLGQLCLQDAKTVVPQRRFGRQHIPRQAVRPLAVKSETNEERQSIP